VRLAVARLHLVNFRSYADARLDVPRGPVVLAGDNGTGKTNCLEAISLLSPGRGLRGAKLFDVQRRAPHHPLVSAEVFDPLGASLWAVAATVLREEDSWGIGTGLSPLSATGTAPRRALHLNGAPAQSADIVELVPMLWLTPAQDRLFAEGAGERRRFLDRLAYGLDPGHARRVSRYERAMRERLRLLTDGRADPVWLDGLEETMAEAGAAIAQARRTTIERLNGELQARTGAFPCAQLTLEDALGADAEDADALRRLFASARTSDAQSARTGSGPHLADLGVRHPAKRADARDCSTGEQKALLISIVLANAWLQKHKNGCAPILLLDEVAAHLDAERRAALFEDILELGAQAWMTGTDRSLFAPLEMRAAMFAVDRGQFMRMQ
jgi:DNA replication and repair protein RecF